MRHLLLWPPLLWTVRLLLLVYAGGLLYITSLYLARFLRPRNAWSLMTGGLPSLTRVEGTAKVLGQELTVNANVNEAGRFQTIEQRVEILEKSILKLVGAADPLLPGTDPPRGQHG
jgi:hypothetical protein